MKLPPLSPDQPAWRCLRTKPKSEHLAARHICTAGYETYSPRLRHLKRTARGRVWFVEALFPGYVFARFPLISHRHIQATACVAGLLEFTPEFGRVPEETVTDLRLQFHDETPYTVEQTFLPGDAVTVAEGPMRGAEAIVTRTPTGRDRVRILLEFLGSPRELEVSLTQLLGFRNPRQSLAGQNRTPASARMVS